jgi:hypothetical protein
METTSTKKDLRGKTFSPIPDINRMEAGYADLYEVNDDINDVSTHTITPCITLGYKAGKVLIDCEKGIKTFVADVLAHKLEEEAFDKEGQAKGFLSKYGLTMDDVKHLPGTETGVWIYYLTKGIERDFGITWEGKPVSIRGKQSSIEKSRQQGKRVLSKKEKNELLERLNYQYYEERVNSGEITQAEAFGLMAEAAAKKKKLEDAGFYLSPKKTEGALLFDYKKEVLEANGREDGYKLYSKNFLDVVIPNILENYYSYLINGEKPSRQLEKEVSKTLLKNSSPLESIENIAVAIKQVEPKLSGDIDKMMKETTLDTAHIIKIKKSGMMKPRYIVFDCTNKKTGEQELYYFHSEMHGTFKN